MEEGNSSHGSIGSRGASAGRQQEEQLQGDGGGRNWREDIDMTYSEDVSPTLLYTKDSLPLIELDSSDEEDSLLIIDEEDLQERKPPPTQVLMLPELETQPKQRPKRQDSEGNLLDIAFDDAIRETKKKAAATPKRPPTGSSSRTPVAGRSMAEKFSFQTATLSPISMRRVSSTPTNSSIDRPIRSVSSPKAASPRGSTLLSGESKRSRANSFLGSPIAKAYAMRRQISLPNSRVSTPIDMRDRSPLLLSPDGYDGTISPDEDDEIAQLAQELATPKSRDRSKIFRSVRIATPHSFRRGNNASAPQAPSTPHGTSTLSDQQKLQRVDTGKTDGSGDELGGLELASTEDADNRALTMIARRRNISALLLSPLQIEGQADENDVGGLQESLESTSTREFETFMQRRSVQYIVFLSTFACFGTIIRVFCGRIFGLDCELDIINDWLSPVSRHICVTASGITEQAGGALFIDLPANMLGSFLLGMLTVLKPEVWPPIPFLKRDHPLQQHDALHVAIKTGMCGSLTTFASWNTQMVVMLDGSQAALGHQIAPALFGYMIGIMTAVASFLFGTHCSAWLNNWRNPEDSGAPKRDVENPPPRIIHFPNLGFSQSRCCQFFKSLTIGRRIPFLILGVLVALFMVADFVFNSQFYRVLWLQVLFTPPGALLRWSLTSRFNNFTIREGWDWLPVGTLAANLLGSLISILLLAVEFRTNSLASSWTMPVVAAIRVGTAGSLSTVSTFVKEIVDMTTRYPHQAKAYYYGLITIGTAMLLSLLVYLPIVRSG
jgi:CrcB protein